MRHLSLSEILALHRRIIERTGGAEGIRDVAALQSSIAQPDQTFGGRELYSSLNEKASALAFFIVRNHPFVDGNKRVGHAALEVMLVLNGFELRATLQEQEQMMLKLASGDLSREQFTVWIRQHTVARVV